MIVVDASAIVELIQGADAERDRIVRMLAQDDHWVVPEHFTVETAHALRGRILIGRSDPDRFLAAIARLEDLALDVWPTRPLLARIAELADNATAYDAAYLALAEELHAPLVTADAKFARVPGTRCTVLGPEQTL